jgi:hypothetical protein
VNCGESVCTIGIYYVVNKNNFTIKNFIGDVEGPTISIPDTPGEGLRHWNDNSTLISLGIRSGLREPYFI